MNQQAALFAILNVDPALRRFAVRAESGLLQALVAGIINAPRQDVAVLAVTGGCCGSVKPHVSKLSAGDY